MIRRSALSEATMTEQPVAAGKILLTALKPKMSLAGKVTRLELSGAVVDVGAEKEGWLHISALGKDSVNRVQDVLVEIHTTDEATKFGVQPEHAVALIKELSQLSHIRVCGLMTMGPFSDNPNDSRSSFRCVADLKTQIEAEGIVNVQMHHLSMGMTHDFEVAIEEGATLVRIGTAIFGRRTKNLN